MTGSYSGAKRTGSRFVKVVTAKKLLKKIKASEIIRNQLGGSGSEYLHKLLKDNGPGNCKGGAAAVIIAGIINESLIIKRVNQTISD